MQQVVVVGAGAIGTVLAGWLSENKTNAVTLVGKEEQITAIATNGLVIQSAPQIGGATQRYANVNAVTTLERLEPDAIVFLATKATHLKKALETIAPAIRSDTTVLTLQNGMGITEIAQDVLDNRCTVIRAILYFASVYLNPGVVQHNGGNKILFASGPHNHQLATLAQGTPLVLQSLETMDQMVFLKAGLNCVINPLSALYRTKVGVLRRPEYEEEVRGITQEVEAIAAAEHIVFNRSLKDTLEQAIEMIANSYSSMYQDVIYGRETEIEFINGAIIELGKKHGIATPYNQSAYDRIKALESDAEVPDMVS